MENAGCVYLSPSAIARWGLCPNLSSYATPNIWQILSKCVSNKELLPGTPHQISYYHK